MIPVEDVKLSRRSRTFAEKILALEHSKKQMAKPGLETPDPDTLHKEMTKDVKKLKSRLDAFQKQIDKAYYKVNPAAENDKPVLESTTLWDFPTQNYGKTKKGDSKFQGVTPAFIIYNMVQRYTQPGDVVLDPMCGSGTTIDVCNEERRQVHGFDVNPTRVCRQTRVMVLNCVDKV